MKKIILSACVLLASAFVLWRAVVVQEMARVADDGMRPLGEMTFVAPPPGPVYLENDSYYWLMMAERMRDEGVWRIRWTHADNVPDGRPVYWSQSIAWLIRLVSFAPGISGHSDSLVEASYWVNPLLEITTIILLAWLLAPLGVGTVVLTLLFFLGLGDVGWAFSTLRPDHQSLQAAVTVLAAAALLRVGFGFGAPKMDGSDRGAPGDGRWPFVLGGVVVGIGFWVSAAAMMPFLVVLALSVAAVAVFHRPNDLPAAVRGWMTFGLAGGATSFLFWLIEFFPALGATRLEVNNPAFSVWVAAAGVAVARVFRLVWGDGGRRNAALLGLAMAGVLCVLLPTIILFGPATWYQPRIVSMDRLHNFIIEFYTLGNFTKGNVLPHLWGAYLLVLPLGALLMVPFLFARGAATRAAVLVLLLLATGLFLMSMRQIRWLAMFAPVLAIAATVAATWLCARLWCLARGWRLVSVILFLVFLGQGAELARRQMRLYFDVSAGHALFDGLTTAVLNKRFATALAATPHRPTAILADPSMAPSLVYFTRIPVLASFYWENVAGDADASEFFADTEGGRAAEIAMARGLSHVIVPSGAIFPNYFDFIKHGHYDTERAKGNLAWKLCQGSALSLPPWLQQDSELDAIGKTSYVFRGKVLEQYLNIYHIVQGKARDAAR